MASSGGFSGRPAYTRTAANFTVAADTGPHPGSTMDLSTIPSGVYTMVLTFQNYGYAYNGWLRFPPAVEISVGGGDNPGPYQHSYTMDVTISVGGSLPFIGEATGGDDMSFQNITATFTQRTC